MAVSGATVVFTDLVGSTAFRSRLGEAAADELRREHDRLLGEAVATHHSRVVRGSGLQIRVGISAGDVTWEGGDCFGLPVVEAARLESAAGAGQIWCAEIVKVLARCRANVPYVPLGDKHLKGLDDPVSVWEVLLCAVTGRPDEARMWFQRAHDRLADRGAILLHPHVCCDEALMEIRLGRAGERAHGLERLDEACRWVDRIGLPKLLPRIERLRAQLLEH